ncbi:hypothetical protein FJZ20_00955 [Candidatus Pacearchaeota archaeon]|nr:hypothetical protein [Candidatus Pacearchaeota archaeon]
MKFNFRQISALATSALLVGMTAGIAAAANYPAPLVQSGMGDFAVVYGARGASTDQAQANLVASNLLALSTGSGSINVEGGEFFALAKDSNPFNFNENLDDVYSSLDSDQMAFLADGTYDDGDVDEDYEQEIALSDKTLSLFADPDYNSDAPTIGFWWTNGQNILNYTVEYNDPVNVTHMVDTALPMLGREYYVLAASITQIDILDTAETTTVVVGDTVTVAGKSVTLNYVDASSAKFTVDGEATGSLAQNSEHKLADDSYIVVTDISYQDYSGGIQSAEFAIGSGKIELINGEEAEINGEDIDGLEVNLTNSSAGTIDSIKLIWNSYRDSFLTATDSISLPEFGVIQLAFGGLNFPSDSEMISIENGDTLTINMGNYDFPLMWYDGATDTAAMGQENNLLKLTEDANLTYNDAGYINGSIIWWDSGDVVDNNVGARTNTTNTIGTDAINVSEDERFLVTLLDTDLTDIETLYYEVSNIDINDAATWTVTLDDLIGNKDLEFTDDIGDTEDVGDVTVTIVGFSADNSSVFFEFDVAGVTTNIYYDIAVSEKGLVITLPEITTAATNATGAILTFTEADRDEDVGGGRSFTATIKNTTNEKFHVSTHNLTAYDEEESDDKYIGYVPSNLASKILFDVSADEYDFSVEYYGKEVTADVRVVAGGEVTTELGNVLVTDAEVSSVQGKNLVVIGGSCINSVAAALVGGAHCTAAWQSATGVGAGQFLIESYTSPYAGTKIALLVAGYNAEDTVNAATYVRTLPQAIDTTVGKKYIGTSATSAELVVQ